MRKWIICILVCLAIFAGFNKVVLVAAVDPLTPYEEAGTCEYKRDMAAISPKDRKCVVEVSNCSIQNGWKASELSEENDNLSYPDCSPKCKCVPIGDTFVPNTCKAYSIGFWGAFTSTFYYATQENFCQPGYRPEAYYSQGTWGKPQCRCVNNTTQPYPSKDAISKTKERGDSDATKQYNLDTKYLYGTEYKLYCEDKGDDEHPYIQTSLGCIPVTTKGFIAWLLPILFSIAGTIAFLILVGGFISLATSQGDPKKMEAARDTITAAITGLLISIFAIFIVRLIIVYILKIPGA